MPHALTMPETHLNHRQTKKTCRLCVVVQSWDGRWVGCFVNLRQKKGPYSTLRIFLRHFCRRNKKKPKETGKNHAGIKSPPNFWFCDITIRDPYSSSPSTPKNIMQHSFGLPLHLLLSHTVPGTGQPMAASLGCPAFLGVWRRRWTNSWYADATHDIPDFLGGFLGIKKDMSPAPILLMVQNSGSPVELDSLSHYLRFFGSTSQVVKKEPDFWINNSTIFRKGGVDEVVFP